jgi:hypothetical protein
MFRLPNQVSVFQEIGKHVSKLQFVSQTWASSSKKFVNAYLLRSGTCENKLVDFQIRGFMCFRTTEKKIESR